MPEPLPDVAASTGSGGSSNGGDLQVGALIGIIVGGGIALLVIAWFAAGPLIGLAASRVEVTGDVETDLPGLDERSVVRAVDGSALAVLADEFDRENVELERVPEPVRQAVLAAEDRRFYEHDGYDVGAIMRAAFANLRAGGVEQGASTISQQLAQTNFLGGQETIRRKLREVSVARALEDTYTKDELLERYLNQVYLGGGAYGLQAGAQEYFRVNVEDLAVEQAALLAGIIRSPTTLDPRDNPEGARQRRDVVLHAMADEGFIDSAEADRLAQAPVEVEPPLERSTDDPYVVEAVKREFFANEELGDSREARIERLFGGGLEVHTTVHPGLQDVADQVVSEAFDDDPGGATAAIAAVKPVDGGILALHGGEDFDEVEFDLATQGRRQPGSALKPLTAASALEQGFPLDITLTGDGPVTFELPGAPEPFEVDNFEAKDHGTVDLREALVSSVNTAFAQLIMASGVEETVELGGKLGIDVEEAFGPQDTWGPSIVLGGLTHGVTPLEMASLYSAFANEGVRAEPYLIERVVDTEGQVLYERDPVATQALDPAVAAAMVDMLQDVVAEGTGTGAQVPGLHPIGKTGTNEDHADAWFVGAVPVMSTAVWVGHPEGQVPMPGMTGGSLPADLWSQFMQAATEGVDVPAFADNVADPSRLPQSLDADDLDLPGPDPTDDASPSPTPLPTYEPDIPPAPATPPPPPEPEPEPSREPPPEPEPSPEGESSSESEESSADVEESSEAEPSPAPEQRSPPPRETTATAPE